MTNKIKELLEEMATVASESKLMSLKASQFESFIEDVVAQLELQLALEQQDEADKKKVALFGIMDAN